MPGGFAIFAGLEQVLDYLENLHFSTEDISYLRSLHVFSEPFLQWLETYQFRGSVYAMPEGSIIYPDEPLLTVYAPLIDAQLVETAILCEINRHPDRFRGPGLSVQEGPEDVGCSWAHRCHHRHEQLLG